MTSTTPLQAPSTLTRSAVRLDHVAKSFGDVQAVRGIGYRLVAAP